jgi:hypothetical protein
MVNEPEFYRMIDRAQERLNMKMRAGMIPER